MSLFIVITLICLSSISKDFIPTTDAEETQDDVNFHLYTRRNPSTSYVLKLRDDRNLANSPLNPRHRTIIFIHGFGEGETSPSSQGIKNAYLKRGQYNVIVVAWSNLATVPWYFSAVKNLPIVGSRAGQFIIWLSRKKAISIPRLHVIGFSLGAHVCAFISQELVKYRTMKIGRITGLDPAGPAFDKFPISTDGLNKADANFVDIIHTNTQAFGISIAIGHADFYVNYGESQPDCMMLDLMCSHGKSWEYYADTISKPYEYHTWTCRTWKPTVSNCFRNKNVFMGFAVNPRARGIFFVRTKSANSIW